MHSATLTPRPEIPNSFKAPTNNAKLVAWVNEIAHLCQPDQVVWCDGSKQEYDAMCQKLEDAGSSSLTPKNA